MRAILILIFFCVQLVEAQELRIASPHWEGYKREFEWAFVDWHREYYGSEPIIRWLDLGGASDTLRYILSESKAKQGKDIGIDILFGGGVDPFVELKRQNLLRPAHVSREILEHIPQSIGGNPIYDKDGAWYSVNLAGFGIIYNKVLLARYGLPTPKEWRDLALPQFSGWVGSADPRKSGSVRFMYELILQYYGWNEGWRIIYGIGANIRTFNNHSSQTPKDIALGEVAVGLLIDSYAREAIREVGEEYIGYVIPKEFPAVYGDGIASLISSPPNPLTDRFIEFCLSPRAQALLMKKVGTRGGPKRYQLGKMSVRPDAYEASKEERLDIAAPWDLVSTFRYDTALAARRWSITTQLLGLLVDNKEEFVLARAQNPDFHLHLPPPVQEALLDTIDPRHATSTIKESEQRLLALLPINRSSSISYILPSLIFISILAFIRIRTIFRRRGS